jgi:ketosteroid isomerase-like protein
VAQNASIARSTYDAWNDRDFDRFSEILKDGEILIVGTGDRLKGSAGARQFAEMWGTAFPDGRVQIDNVVESGSNVVLEFTGTGTHTGPLRTPMGEFDPTDKPLVLKLCDVWTFASDGTPTELRTYFDSGSMMAQLGLTPQMAGAGITA